MGRRSARTMVLLIASLMLPAGASLGAAGRTAEGKFEITVSKGDHSETRSGSFGVSSEDGETEGVFRYFGVEIARIWIGAKSSAVKTREGMHFSNDPSIAAADAAHGLPVPVALLSAWAMGSDTPSAGDGWRTVSSSGSGREASIVLEWLSPRSGPGGRLRIGIRASVRRPG